MKMMFKRSQRNNPKLSWKLTGTSRNAVTLLKVETFTFTIQKRKEHRFKICWWFIAILLAVWLFSMSWSIMNFQSCRLEYLNINVILVMYSMNISNRPAFFSIPERFCTISEVIKQSKTIMVWSRTVNLSNAERLGKFKQERSNALCWKTFKIERTTVKKFITTYLNSNEWESKLFNYKEMFIVIWNRKYFM